MKTTVEITINPHINPNNNSTSAATSHAATSVAASYAATNNADNNAGNNASNKRSASAAEISANEAIGNNKRIKTNNSAAVASTIASPTNKSFGLDIPESGAITYHSATLPIPTTFIPSALSSSSSSTSALSKPLSSLLPQSSSSSSSSSSLASLSFPVFNLPLSLEEFNKRMMELAAIPYREALIAPIVHRSVLGLPAFEEMLSAAKGYSITTNVCRKFKFRMLCILYGEDLSLKVLVLRVCKRLFKGEVSFGAPQTGIEANIFAYLMKYKNDTSLEIQRKMLEEERDNLEIEIIQLNPFLKKYAKKLATLEEERDDISEEIDLITQLQALMKELLPLAINSQSKIEEHYFKLSPFEKKKRKLQEQIIDIDLEIESLSIDLEHPNADKELKRLQRQRANIEKAYRQHLESLQTEINLKENNDASQAKEKEDLNPKNYRLKRRHLDPYRHGVYDPENPMETILHARARYSDTAIEKTKATELIEKLQNDNILSQSLYTELLWQNDLILYIKHLKAQLEKNNIVHVTPWFMALYSKDPTQSKKALDLLEIVFRAPSEIFTSYHKLAILRYLTQFPDMGFGPRHRCKISGSDHLETRKWAHFYPIENLPAVVVQYVERIVSSCSTLLGGNYQKYEEGQLVLEDVYLGLVHPLSAYVKPQESFKRWGRFTTKGAYNNLELHCSNTALYPLLIKHLENFPDLVLAVWARNSLQKSDFDIGKLTYSEVLKIKNVEADLIMSHIKKNFASKHLPTIRFLAKQHLGNLLTNDDMKKIAKEAFEYIETHQDPFGRYLIFYRDKLSNVSEMFEGLKRDHPTPYTNAFCNRFQFKANAENMKKYCDALNAEVTTGLKKTINDIQNSVQNPADQAIATQRINEAKENAKAYFFIEKCKKHAEIY